MTTAAALAAAMRSGNDHYAILLQHGSMELGYYNPQRHDPQSPHAQDELYIVQSGSGTFVLGDRQHPFECGEALFVPAGTVHRFVDFSDDFAAWVVFYGANGGERTATK